MPTLFGEQPLALPESGNNGWNAGKVKARQSCICYIISEYLCILFLCSKSVKI